LGQKKQKKQKQQRKQKKKLPKQQKNPYLRNPKLTVQAAL
jgi:hypothetical protein